MTPLSTPAAQGTVAGWKLVPVEPTLEMLRASPGTADCHPETWRKAMWSAMLSASPSPEALPASGPPDVERVEMEDWSKGYAEDAEPIWRIVLDGYCADFPSEGAARDFANAIGRRSIALPASGVEWRTMESAPRDGRWFAIRDTTEYDVLGESPWWVGTARFERPTDSEPEMMLANGYDKGPVWPTHWALLAALTSAPAPEDRT